MRWLARRGAWHALHRKVHPRLDSLMTLRSPWGRRTVAWAGALLIAAVLALAAFDIVRTHRAALADTAQDLDGKARILAEHTARGLQAVEIALRHIADEHRRGALAGLAPQALQAYLREQSVGLAQVKGLAMHDRAGEALALSWAPPGTRSSIAHFEAFRVARERADAGVWLGAAVRSPHDGEWMIPVGRRLETPDGRFAGTVGARLRIDYFTDFYRDIKLEAGTRVTLMHRDGTLLARYPLVPGAVGQHIEPSSRDVLAAPRDAGAAPVRLRSPVDGVDRYVALQAVAGYPVDVIVSRDADAVLGAWRTQAAGTTLRTLALAALAVLLLLIVARQFRRLDAARDRFALAVAGSDDGIWDWDYVRDTVFASARARELMALPPGPEVQTFEAWFGALRLHPDDVPRRQAAIDAHLEGRAPAYEVDYRVRHGEGDAVHYRWVRVRGLCVRDAQGRPLRLAGSIADIDALKRAEASLRESEGRYELAVAGSDDGIWEWDFVRECAFESVRARELQGLPPGPELQPLPDLLASLRVHPDDAQRRADAIQAHLLGLTPAYECEYRVRHGDDTYRWIRVRALCVRDAEGLPQRMAGSVSDIDARQQAEQALRLSEERYALAMTGSNEGHWVWNLETDEIYASPTLRALLCIPSGLELPTRTDFVARIPLHPEDRDRLRHSMADHLSGRIERIDHEYRVVDPGCGDVRWLHTRAQCVRDADGRPTRMAGATVEVTQRKRAEEALRRSEERYELAVLGSTEGLWDWDMESDMLFLSARCQELLWQTAGEPLRPRREWIDATDYHPDDVAPLRAAVSAHLHGHTQHLAVEYRLRHHGGDWHWYRQRGVAVRDAQGKPYRMAGSMEDITERKRSEAERERLEQQLRQSQRLEAMGTLAGGIAHDFNNILAAIVGYGEMVQKEADEGTPMKRHIDATMRAAMRAKSLVERILAFSRSGMGERVPVHVQSVVGEALDLVLASLPSRVRLRRELDCGHAAVLGDATQIHQVVMNLCANAVQAMGTAPRGGTLEVTLDCRDIGGPISVSTGALTPGRYVVLKVGDTGVGIAPRVLDRMFDPFFTTKDIGVGTGLGLSLVHGIVTDLGGGIEVASELGRGTTMTVYLPSSGETQPSAPTDEAPTPGRGETVLLVDDEEALVRLGEELMAQLGYEPVGFTSSTAALASFRRTPRRFDIVITDEAMPEMTGSEFVREIRKIRPELPVVMMTGYVTASLTARAREAGIQEVLGKPLVAREIARSVAAALRH
jgi:PAS domain S-box-containing protein